MPMDLFGKAVKDYFEGNCSEDIINATNITENDILPVSYLFRTYEKMPEIEQRALDLSIGKILDIGCCAGSHSLHLQKKGLDITALDISKGAIEICKRRGVKKAIHKSIYDFKGASFDTLLLMMNGVGVCGYLENLPLLLHHLKSLLNEKGQILMDSSDIIYMYPKDMLSKLNYYYGEVDFQLSYRGMQGVPFPWVYLDYDTLEKFALNSGFYCEKILDGEHYDYLARLFL
ncbi:MAG: class I SAM-dependent methyltransferase [Flavobacteriales bacterium]